MSLFDRGGLTAREEWQEILDREEQLDVLFGRSPFRDPEDYAEPRYAAAGNPGRASEVDDEGLAA